MNKVVIKGVAVGLAFAVAMGVAYKGDVFKSKADKVTKTKVEMTSGETEGKIYDYEVIPMNTRDRRSKLKINLDDMARESFENYKDSLVNELQYASSAINENNIEDILNDTISDVDCDVDVSATIDHAIRTGEIATGSEVELEVEDENTASDGEGQKYEINDELSITFFDNGMMSIDYLSGEEEQDIDELIDEENEYDEVYEETDDYQDEDDDDDDDDDYGEVTRGGKGNKVKTAKSVSFCYDIIVGKIFGPEAAKVAESYICAEFTYNKTKKKCTARRKDFYSKRYFFGAVGTEIYNVSGGVQKPSKAKRVAYQSAMVAVGFTYKGVGVNLGEKYMKAAIVCNSSGKIKDESICR